MKIKSLIAIVLASSLAFGSTTSFAESIDNAKTNNEEQRPPKHENEIIGKITYISANSVTISLAERKEREKKDISNLPEKPKFDEQNNEQKDFPKLNLDDMFTLTGESTTIDISSATFDEFKDRKQKENFSNETTDAETKKTYTDFKVGEYVMVELTSSTSKTAKSVRHMDMMRRFDKPKKEPHDKKPNEKQ